MGSASLITDENGNEYQRLEYTPYGEVWVDKYSQIQESTALLPYKFTGKERDEETGLYYYGARYLDAKYSRWISTDPALGEYIPAAGKATVKEAGKLAGQGGIFNSVNQNLYNYAGNNPIKYTDPDGRQVAVPIPYSIPFTLPKIAPIPIPGEVVIPPLLPGNILPYQNGTHYIEKPWDGDWHHAPNGPNLNDPNSNPLGDEWEPDHDANNKDPTGNRHFINKKTGEKARWDVPTKKDSKPHWHRENPNRSGDNKYKKYLDPDGNPVKEDKPGAHIYPNPIMEPVLIT